MADPNLNEAFVDLGNRVLIKVEFLTPKTVLNCPAFDKDGNVIKPAYSPFTQEDIDKLLVKGTREVYYTKAKAEEYQTAYTKKLKEYLKNNVYQGPRSITSETQKKAVKVSEKIVSLVRGQKTIDFAEAKPVIDSVLHDLSTSSVDVINLLDIQEFDDHTHTHSLNVGVISIAFAQKIGMPDEAVKDIGLAGFLHDIGKIRFPYTLIHKNGPLTQTEFNLIKKHPRYSYEIIKDSNQLSDRVKQIVLLHHEKYDGSGYPFGFKDGQIENGVYVVSMAEFYDALTTNLSYKNAFTSKEALKQIVNNAGIHFKPELAHSFVRNMGMLFKECNYYDIGDYVLLSTNEVAKVINKDSRLDIPAIEIIQNAKGRSYPKPIYVDLKGDSLRSIIRKVDPNTIL